MSENAKARILVIDDEPSVIRILDANLTMEGYQVLGAANGEEGLARARHDKPDLIILDLMMPKMNGWQVLDCLKADPATASTPVVVLTVVDELTLNEYRRLEKAQGYLPKPFEPLELLDKVRTLLGQEEKK